MARFLVAVAVLGALALTTATLSPAHGASPSPPGPFTIDTINVCVSHGGSGRICQKYAINEKQREIFKTIAECQKTGYADALGLAQRLAVEHFPGKKGISWVARSVCRKTNRKGELSV